MEEKKYRLPVPMLNYKEEHSLVALTRRYEKMTRPGAVEVEREDRSDYSPASKKSW